MRRRREGLEAWLDKVLTSFGVLPMDAPAIREWARLMYRRSDTMMVNAMFAAAATRTVSEFEQLRVGRGYGLTDLAPLSSGQLLTVPGTYLGLPEGGDPQINSQFQYPASRLL